MRGFHKNIEQETRDNTDYRRVLYTGKNSQLVVMCLEIGQEIGEEVHHVDQFFRFESGNGKVIIDGNEYTVSDGDAMIIPAGSRHNVINISGDAPLKLYSIYSPPWHIDGIIHRTKADETEEYFSGKTTE